MTRYVVSPVIKVSGTDGRISGVSSRTFLFGKLIKPLKVENYGNYLTIVRDSEDIPIILDEFGKKSYKDYSKLLKEGIDSQAFKLVLFKCPEIRNDALKGVGYEISPEAEQFDIRDMRKLEDMVVKSPFGKEIERILSEELVSEEPDLSSLSKKGQGKILEAYITEIEYFFNF